MLNDKELIKTSRFLSLILRHKPETIGISLDKNGWAKVSQVIKGMREKGYTINLEILDLIVTTDDKQRYSFDTHKTRIRANQGHSIDVDVQLKECQPPEFLYHGTGEKYQNSIEENGLVPKSRLYVHLSADKETALNVGKRHGKPIIYKVAAQRMYEQGIKFYLSENNVWLTKKVDKEFLLRGW